MSSSSSSRQQPKTVFGQSMYKNNKKHGGSSNNTNYQRQFGGGGGGSNSNNSHRNYGHKQQDQDGGTNTTTSTNYRTKKNEMTVQVEMDFGIQTFGAITASSSGGENLGATTTSSSYNSSNRTLLSSSTTTKQQQRRGWLYNMIQTTVIVSDESSLQGGSERSGIDLYFVSDDVNGSTKVPFKSTILYRPYFYVIPDIEHLLQQNVGGGGGRGRGTSSSMNDDDDHDHENEDDTGSGGGDTQLPILFELLTSSLHRLYDDMGLYTIEIVYKQDLDQINHLSPNKVRGRPMLKLIFDTTTQLIDVRNSIRDTIITKNLQRHRTTTMSSSSMILSMNNNNKPNSMMHQQQQLYDEPLQYLTDIREYDVPYIVRVCTDLDIRAGTWYTVQLPDDDNNNIDAEHNTSNAIGKSNISNPLSSSLHSSSVQLLDPDRESKANPIVLAFDIECTKAALKFPNPDIDEIFMISYMVYTPDRGPQGYLIVSRSVVSADISDFEYTPKVNYPGPFHIFNEPNEQKLLQRFFQEFRKHCPQIVVTYNGDFFDFPYVDTRAKIYNMNLYREIGIELVGGTNMNSTENGSAGNNNNNNNAGTYRGRLTVHLDAFHWVQRDSYLPQGAQGLKAVTKYKLGYDPVEVDPEDMVRFAHEKPIHMATYSVSDAVATYYLYQMYVHLFIFSLCTIIPMGPEDVLGKGSGTLCEALLMVQACKKNIICPNKHTEDVTKFHNGHLLESETYIGGKVECLETGVYRSDLEYEFQLQPSAFQQLINNVDRDLTFTIEVENGKRQEDVTNYNEIRQGIVDKLAQLRDNPKRNETPYIYHLDVGAMYPNIILTNRLQPNSIVNDATCAACDYNQSKNECKRRMDWVWRGDYNPATKAEYERTKDQLNREVHRDGLSFNQLPEKEQASLTASRLKEYARKAYKKTKVTEEETRTDVVCMRENDFYVDTVRQFRDRRYEYKKMNKDWKKKASQAQDAVTKKRCEDRVMVYDSLQIAHKCILNSFYGYVMRKGARWRSMEMAGIVTKTGSDIITEARILVEQIGRPLELDTDGIWCILPGSFPDTYTFSMSDGSNLKVDYPCLMLNANVHDKFSNHQYQSIDDPDRGTYKTRSECSIFFEVDGPYRCMVIPASIEEGKLLKKRYAVFNFDGSLAELKGFELKRRGELELIKTFQSQVFEHFLEGTTLKECYDCVANVANHWIDVIDTRGESLDTDELVDLISENRSMSRQLDDYGEQKGTSQTTARRLSEFLGAEIIKDKGLNCKFIIAEQPFGAPVTERAIPTAIWKAEPTVTKYFLRKWLKSPGLDDEGLDIRNILDWDYYLDRLGKTIQKIISIPAALQKVQNPVPRVPHPDWLESKVKRLNDRFQQQSIRSIFGLKQDTQDIPRPIVDIEDMDGGSGNVAKRPIIHKMHIRRSSTEKCCEQDNKEAPQTRADLTKDSFDDWLKQKKALWRKTLTDRKHSSSSKFSFGGDPKKQRKVPISMDGFIRDAASSLNEKEWQILEVREMSSYDTQASLNGSGSGDFLLWAMVGSSSLQKIVVTVPRVIYVSTRQEITTKSEDFIDFRRVEKRLPHGKSATFLYEISMLEHIYKAKKWTSLLKPVKSSDKIEQVIDTMYESETPLLTRLLAHLGSIVKVNQNAARSKKKSFFLTDLSRVDRPSGGEYIHRQLAFKRVFLYIRINTKTKTGIVALFTLGSGMENSGTSDPEETVDVTRPAEYKSSASFDIGASCFIWIVKPQTRNSQRNVSVKQCETLFGQLLETIQDAAGTDSDYSCVSSSSSIRVSSLNIVESEALAYAGANEVISSQSKSTGPTVILLNTSRPTSYIRRYMSTFGTFPVVSMSFPPGPAHDPLQSALPSLNWEVPAVQLSLEAYLFMIIISFPKRVSYCRYGQVPLGNLGDDENNMVFDVSLTRVILKNRAISWASCIPGRSDIGVTFLPLSEGGIFPSSETSGTSYSQDEIWSDDDELVSPIVRRSGCYRSICVEIDLQDLAIASLTNSALSVPQMGPGGADPNSPTSVALFGSGVSLSKQSSPLGDEMSTSISLPIIRALVSGWLKDAFTTSSHVADELLHHIYRLISDPDTLFHDPALHRMIHSLMKSTFLRLLSELQRLGCTIVYASFHKIIVATNKLELSDAEEYINFVIDTARRQSVSSGDQDDTLAKVSLRPRQFHTHFVFLDEYNYGTMHLDRVNQDDIDDSIDFAIPDSNENSGTVVVPSVVSAWSIMNYLGNEAAQEYFRAIIGRFSKDVLRKQMEVTLQDGILPIAGAIGLTQQVVQYKRKMISKHFAAYLTRAVGEIQKDGFDEKMIPPLLLPDQSYQLRSPALEFIKNVVTVLELDPDIEHEVHRLKRSLLTQVGVAEYSKVAAWVNPCPMYMLPDVFCSECQESRDVNLCFIPPRPAIASSDIDIDSKQWVCEDCGVPYNASMIEGRLIHILRKKMVRYVLQDVRCIKTNRVATRTLTSFLSDCSTTLKLDISPDESIQELQLLRNLAEYHALELLQETVDGMLTSYRYN